MNADGTGQTRLTNDRAEISTRRGRPTAGIVVHSSATATEIYVMNADGTGQTRLTTTQTSEFNPAWSPDGTRIAFHSDREGNWEIYLMNSDGSAQTRITDKGPGAQSDVVARRDKIAFQTERDDKVNDTFEIYVMNPDGSDLRRLTNNSAIDQVPDW